MLENGAIQKFVLRDIDPYFQGKQSEILRRFSFKLLGMIPDITCKSFAQIGLQIPRWRTKLRL